MFVLPDVSHHGTLMQLFGSDGGSHVKTHTHTCTPDTESNIIANETGPLVQRVHAALRVTVTAGREKVRKKSQQGRGGGTAAKRGGSEKEWILLIAIVIPP